MKRFIVAIWVGFVLVFGILFATTAFATTAFANEVQIEPGESVTVEASDYPDPDGDGYYEFSPEVLNRLDRCVGHNDALDLDEDGTPDGCDGDIDGDGRPNDTDFAPYDKLVQDKPKDCNGVDVGAGADLDARVSEDPTATYCLAGATYFIDELVILRDGGKLVGETGEIVTKGPASYPIPKTKIRPEEGSNLFTLISRRGADTQLRWLDISGAKGGYRPSTEPGGGCPQPNLPADSPKCPNGGTGNAVGDGQATRGTITKYVSIHGNDAAGILNTQGRILYSEFYDNTRNNDFEGFNASSVKAIREVEIGFSYSHDEQANGLWFDHSESDRGNEPEMDSNPGGGAYFHHNYLSDCDRWCMRHEFAPKDAKEGQTLPTPSFMAEDNVIERAGYGGLSIRDAQNSTAKGNVFREMKTAISASDSKKDDRTDLANVTIEGNDLGGGTLKDCTLSVVTCRENTP